MLGDGMRWAHRSGNDAFAVARNEGGPARAWMRMRYALTLGRDVHRVETVIAIFGAAHIRVHRFMLAPHTLPLAAADGAAALGYSPGMIPGTGVDPVGLQGTAWVDGGTERSRAGRKVAIRAIRGYSRITLSGAWLGQPLASSVYAHALLPMLHIDDVQDGHVAACAVHIGPVDASASRDLIDALQSVEWGADGDVNLTFRDHTVTVAPLTTS
jgi:hypothetical protein